MTDQLPAEIAEAIEAYGKAAFLHGLETGDGTGTEDEAGNKAEAARAALDAVILAHLGGWKPISTLPDGVTEAIISDGNSVGEGFWHDGTGCHRAGPGWFWETDRGDLLTAKNAYVTHWRPLPDPPATDLGRAALADDGRGT